MHRLDTVYRVAAVLFGGIETVATPQFFQKHRSRFFPDAHSPVALNIAMTPNRTDTGSRPANIAAQQKKVYQLANRCDRISVLRQAHRPATDDVPGLEYHSSRFTNLVPGETAAIEDLLPASIFQRGNQSIVTGCISSDKVMIEDFPWRPSLFLQELFHDALEQSKITVDFCLEPEIRQMSALPK